MRIDSHRIVFTIRRVRASNIARRKLPTVALACAAALAGVASLVTAPPSAAAVAKPALSVTGLPIGKIGGANSPYTETGSIVYLHLSYKGALPKGAKLELLVRKSYTSPWVASKTPIKLAGGSAKIKVTSSGIGGPYAYEVAVVAGKTRLAISKPVGIYWAQPPAGVFGSDEYESAYTSVHAATQNCEAGCKGDASSGSSTEAYAQVGPTPMPQGWTVTLLFNGEVICSTKDIEGRCSEDITFPTVTTETVVPLVGEMTSPTGKVTKATLLVTVYP
jgi:hypothetical protein